jgi:predicted peroxiredoxin
VAKFFVMFSTDPDVDPRKCVVGLACAAQAVSDGHEVQTFFASHSVKLLHANYINAIDVRVGMPDGASRALVDQLASGASIACSTGSQAVVGVTPDNADDVLVGGLDLEWSGPPGVVAMSAQADTTLSF